MRKIITIIVLLILAGVSISLVVGDNGVLTQATKASNNTDQASVDSALQTALAGLQTNFMGNIWVDDVNQTLVGNIKYDELKSELEKYGYTLVQGFGKAKTPISSSTPGGDAKLNKKIKASNKIYIAETTAAADTDDVYTATFKANDTSFAITVHAKLTTKAED